MKIYHLNFDVSMQYEALAFDKVDLDLIKSFSGIEKKEFWEPLRVKRMYGDREFSNAPYLVVNIPVVDYKAMKALDTLLTDNAELLPLACNDGEFFAVNITSVADVLDYDKSDYTKFSYGNRIMNITNYAFHEDKVKNIDLFKLVDEPLKRAFVSERFKQRVEEQGLTGFKFELVWDSEESLETE